MAFGVHDIWWTWHFTRFYIVIL